MTTEPPAQARSPRRQDGPARVPRGAGGDGSLARGAAEATVAVALALGLGLIMQRLPHANLSVLFLTVVVIVAARSGLWPSIYAALLSSLVFNFFFTTPEFTLAVEEEGDVATLVFFLLMAMVAGNLAARMRGAIARNEAALTRISGLYEFSRSMAAAVDVGQVLQVLVNEVAAAANRPAVALIPGPGDRLRLRARSVRLRPTSRPPAAALEKAWESGRSYSRREGWAFTPLSTTRGKVGLLAIETAEPSLLDRDLITTLCDQAAVAVERTLLAGDLEQARLASEREQLRSALLSSVSHDLRTPLASIVGATSTVLEYDGSLKPGDREELLRTVLEEAERLNRYIQNLLDMTRLGQGELIVKRGWEDLRDLVGSAAGRLRSPLERLALTTEIGDGAQLVFVNGDLFEQALVNLLENAARYSPPGGRIAVSARREGDTLEVTVADQGPGIPAEERERVFDMFYRVREGDRRVGTGLGLSICRAVVQAHGGEIGVADPPTGVGARLRIAVPQPAEGPRVPES